MRGKYSDNLCHFSYGIHHDALFLILAHKLLDLALEILHNLHLYISTSFPSMKNLITFLTVWSSKELFVRKI